MTQKRRNSPTNTDCRNNLQGSETGAWLNFGYAHLLRAREKKKKQEKKPGKVRNITGPFFHSRDTRETNDINEAPFIHDLQSLVHKRRTKAARRSSAASNKIKNPRAIYHLHYVWGAGGDKTRSARSLANLRGRQVLLWHSRRARGGSHSAGMRHKWRAHSLWWHRLLLGALTLHWRHVGLCLYYCRGRIVRQWQIAQVERKPRAGESSSTLLEYSFFFFLTAFYF